jgi:hypothetical protein
MEPTLVKNVNPKEPETYYLSVKCPKVLRGSNRSMCLDSPAFLTRFTFRKDTILFNWSFPTPPIIFADYFQHQNYSLADVNEKFIPQLMQGLMHAHSRNLVVGVINPHMIGIHDDCAYIMDVSNSVFQLCDVPVDPSVDTNDYSAPETVYNKVVVPQSDNYGLALTWICALQRQTIDVLLPERSVETIHAYALEKATDVQKNMLTWKWKDRALMPEVYAASCQWDIAFKRSEFLTAVESCYTPQADGFNRLTELQTLPQHSWQLRYMMPALLLRMTKDLGHRSVKLMTAPLRATIDKYLKFLVRVSSMDKGKKDESYLSKTKAEDTVNLNNLMAHFVAVNATMGFSILREFIDARVIALTDDFVMELYASGIPEHATQEFFAISKTTAAGRALQAAQSHYEGLYGKVISEIRAESADKEQLIEDLRGQLEQKKVEVENLKRQLSEENSIHEKIAELIAKKRKQ